MLWWVGYGGLRVVFVNFGELMMEYCDFFFVFLFKSYVGLFYGVDFFFDYLYFVDLSVYCKKGLLVLKFCKE